MENINLDDWIPLREAAKFYNRDASAFLHRLKDAEVQGKRPRQDLIKGRDAIKLGNIWLLKKERLKEIYGY